MGDVYVLGGCIDWKTVNSCFRFNPTDFNWTETSEMNVERRYASCAVFEGTIVVY